VCCRATNWGLGLSSASCTLRVVLLVWIHYTYALAALIHLIDLSG